MAYQFRRIKMPYKTLVKILSLFLFGLSSVQAVEIDLLGKLDNAEEYATNPQQRMKAKHTIMQMLIACEFDEQCELGMIDKLEVITKNDPNIMYKGFLTYLKWEKNDLLHNIKFCQIDEKRQVRKIFAACYAKWLEDNERSPENRNAIDKKESQRYQCYKEKFEPLAEQGNIFAQAAMVNVGEYFKDSKLMTMWSNKIQSQQGTPKYQKFMDCSELP